MTCPSLRVSASVSDSDIYDMFDRIIEDGAVENIECVGDEKIIRIVQGSDADDFYEMLERKGFLRVFMWDRDRGRGYNTRTAVNIRGLLAQFEVRYAENNVVRVSNNFWPNLVCS